MFTIKRVSTSPASPIQVSVDQPDGTDGGFQQGGVFYFQPAGQEGDTHQVTQRAAEAIMGDPGLAQHFECLPPLPSAGPAVQEATRTAKKPKGAPKGGDDGDGVL